MFLSRGFTEYGKRSINSLKIIGSNDNYLELRVNWQKLNYDVFMIPYYGQFQYSFTQ